MGGCKITANVRNRRVFSKSVIESQCSEAGMYIIAESWGKYLAVLLIFLAEKSSMVLKSVIMVFVNPPVNW